MKRNISIGAMVLATVFSGAGSAGAEEPDLPGPVGLTVTQPADAPPGDPAESEAARLRPRGRPGRFGIGVGVVGRSDPYRGGDSTDFRLIPSLTYIGERVQVFGPSIKVKATATGRVSTAVTGRYAFRAYEEGDSPALRGLGDRDDTFLAGVSATVKAGHGFELQAGYEHDVLDRIGGGMATVQLRRSFPVGSFLLTPSLGVDWMSRSFSNDAYGVPEDRATADRPGYRLGDTVQPNLGLGGRVRLGSDWQVALNLSVGALDRDVRRSPIVDDDVVIGGFAAVSYTF